MNTHQEKRRKEGKKGRCEAACPSGGKENTDIRKDRKELLVRIGQGR